MRRGKVFIVCGLTFGDEGKGTVVDVLSRHHRAQHVIRFNGGPQAGHNVVTPDGRWHCFAQFGAGTLSSGARTFLSHEMLIEPEALLVEADVLRSKGAADALARLTIDPGCVIVTPMHKMVGQMLEISRGSQPFGSCGQGVGQAIRDQENGLGLTVADLQDDRLLRDRLYQVRQVKFQIAEQLLQEHPIGKLIELFGYFLLRSDLDQLRSTYRSFLRQPIKFASTPPDLLLKPTSTIIFEGAQGALLDRRRGFTPFVTQSQTSFHNVESILGHSLTDPKVAEHSIVQKIGVLRAYGHRHGPGPLVTEDESLRQHLSDPYNPTNPWQGKFRLGWLDLVALRHGLAINDGVDGLAITGLDRLSGLPRILVATAYRYHGDLTLLSRYFAWEPTGPDSARIIGFCPEGMGDNPVGELASLLEHCQPEYLELPGWSEPLTDVHQLSDLPSAAQQLIELLQGPDGLNTPVHIISVGPTADQKLLLS